MAAPVAYRFFSVWNLPTSVEATWELLLRPDRGHTEHALKPQTTRTRAPRLLGVGAEIEATVRGLLPVTFRYSTTIVALDRPEQIHSLIDGDLIGRCRQALVGHEHGTDVLTFWDVRTASHWPTALAGSLRWLFAWNHNRAMRAAERDLLLLIGDRRQPSTSPPCVLAERVTLDGLPHLHRFDHSAR